MFDVLQVKASEAAAEQVRFVQRAPGISEEQFATQQHEVSELRRLMVRFQGASGEWMFVNSVEGIQEDSLPAVLTNLAFECGPLYRARYNLFPQNQFSVVVDFTRTSIADLTNLALGTGIGSSVVNVSGVNTTWVNAVDHELRSFFDDIKTHRGWLHSRFAYDFALFFVGVPISLDVIYNLDKHLSRLVTLPPAVFVALYVYLVLVVLLLFRICFNYAKWALPKIEGPPRKHGAATFHKTVLGAIFIALLVRAVTTVLWFIGIRLH